MTMWTLDWFRARLIAGEDRFRATPFRAVAHGFLAIFLSAVLGLLVIRCLAGGPW